MSAVLGISSRAGKKRRQRSKMSPNSPYPALRQRGSVSQPVGLARSLSYTPGQMPEIPPPAWIEDSSGKP